MFLNECILCLKFFIWKFIIATCQILRNLVSQFCTGVTYRGLCRLARNLQVFLWLISDVSEMEERDWLSPTSCSSVLIYGCTQSDTHLICSVSFTEASCHAELISSCSHFQWGHWSSSLNWAFLEPLGVTYSAFVAVAKAESQEIKHTDPEELETSSPHINIDMFTINTNVCNDDNHKQVLSISWSFVSLRVIINFDLLLMQSLSEIQWYEVTILQWRITLMLFVSILFYKHAVFSLKKLGLKIRSQQCLSFSLSLLQALAIFPIFLLLYSLLQQSSS